MIPVLRSIDSLLNRFDELSHRHASFVANFDTNFTDIENPLHSVARDEEEQRKTTENLLKTAMENDQLESVGAVEDFNRRVKKSRCQNRPPSYSSNDSSSVYHRVPSRSSWATTESAPPQLTSKIAMIKTGTSQRIRSSSMDDIIEPKTRVTTKIKPKILPQNSPTIRRNARSQITTFTMETAIRLSRPRTCHYSPDQKVSPKRVHRRMKPFQTIKKETLESSITSIPSTSPRPLLQSATPPSKRINSTIIKSSPKKLKAENRFVPDNSKRILMSNYPRPAIYLVPPPTICLTFPMQPELKASRFVVIPKANAMKIKKPLSIFTNKKSIIPPNRLMYLMT
jgi:hypothetical protein